MTRAVISLTHAGDDAERTTLALLVAVGSLDAGNETALWLSAAGIELALKGTADAIAHEGMPAVASLLAQFQEKGGTVLVCPICFKIRNLDAADLIDGAELKGAAALWAFVGDGATTFAY